MTAIKNNGIGQPHGSQVSAMTTAQGGHGKIHAAEGIKLLGKGKGIKGGAMVATQERS